FFFSSRRRHTRFSRDWSSDVCSSDLHYYAMLPLVFKTSNVAGHTDYVDGLFPQIPLQEDYFNLGQLGEPTEPLLAAALFEIAGRSEERRVGKECRSRWSTDRDKHQKL